MPELRYYTVTQTRSVEIVANEAEDAATIATLIFQDKYDKPENMWGHSITDVQVNSLTVVRKG